MIKIHICWLVLVVLIIAMETMPVLANREHKVHNIVLYPNKQSWCTTRNISQVITEPGCKQITIDNNVCVGACFSYSIPHTEPSDPGEVIGPYCDSCQPSNVSYEFVKVDCTESSNMKSPYLLKQVQLIHNCSCTACEEQSTRRSAPNSSHVQTNTSQEQQHQVHNENHPPLTFDKDQPSHHHRVYHHPRASAQADLPSTSSSEFDDHTGSDTIQDDIPEILEVVHYSENDTEPIRHTPLHDFQTQGSVTTYLQEQQLNHYEHNSHTDNVKKLLHQKITKLLQSIEDTNSQTDREQLIEMILLIKGTSDRNWDELVENLQSENSIIDFNRLRSELVEEEPLDVPFVDRRHRVNDVDHDGKDNDNEGDAQGASVKKEHSHPQYDNHQRLMHHQYDSIRHLHDHRTVGSQDHAVSDSFTSFNSATSSGEIITKQHHHAHHIVGERIDAHHHLERGPHNALVIRANKDDQEIHRSRQNGHEITEQINIHAHDLKPNHAGTIMTYNSQALAMADSDKLPTHELQQHLHSLTHHPHHQRAHEIQHKHTRAHGLQDHDWHGQHAHQKERVGFRGVHEQHKSPLPVTSTDGLHS